MFKRGGKLITYVMPIDGKLPDDVLAGAYDFDGDMWQWTREL